jgi:cobalt-zinc-cadmium efflux system protein
MASHSHGAAGHAQEHGHGHDHGAGAGEGRLRAALALTAAFMLAEVVAGVWSGSLALLADAGHMLTDAGSLALALYAANAGRRAADPRRTYGYGRARVLAAFVNGLLLLLVAAWIVFEAVGRLREPLHVLAGPMLVVAAVGLAVNVAAYLILRGGTDLNSRSALAHVIGDLLGSVCAIGAALIILGTGWMPADPLLSVLVALLVARTGWGITRESAHVLLEGTPAGFDAARIEAELSGLAGVAGVHHIHVWALADDQPLVTMHAQLTPGAERQAALDTILDRLRVGLGCAHATVQLEEGPCPDAQGGSGCHGPSSR